jgi:hypothetical protein
LARFTLKPLTESLGTGGGLLVSYSSNKKFLAFPVNRPSRQNSRMRRRRWSVTKRCRTLRSDAPSTSYSRQSIRLDTLSLMFARSDCSATVLEPRRSLKSGDAANTGHTVLIKYPNHQVSDGRAIEPRSACIGWMKINLRNPVWLASLIDAESQNRRSLDAGSHLVPLFQYKWPSAHQRSQQQY